MALIPDDPKQRNALLAIVAALALFYVFWSYWYGPAVEENDADRARLETLEASNRAARLTATRGGADLEERLALYQRHVMQLEQLIPASEEVPQLLRTIVSEAARLDVELATYQPEPEVPGEYYTETGYSLRAYGDYHNMGRFLTAIASLPRIITPVDLDLNPFTGTTTGSMQFQAPVVATFRIKTYVLPEGGPPAAQMGGEAGT